MRFRLNEKIEHMMIDEESSCYDELFVVDTVRELKELMRYLDWDEYRVVDDSKVSGKYYVGYSYNHIHAGILEVATENYWLTRADLTRFTDNGFVLICQGQDNDHGMFGEDLYYIKYVFEDYTILARDLIDDTDLIKQFGKLLSEEIHEDGKEWFEENLTEDLTAEVDSQGNELTAEQISFFRNSKVRDRNGNLLVVYHGTPHKFDTFDKTKVGSRFTFLMGGEYSPKYTLGFYFTDDKHYASTVGNDGLRNTIKECYLNIENPLVLNVSGWGGSVAYADICHSDIKRWSVGYDGVIINHYDEDDKEFLEDRVIIAFEPNQIKSITNKSPTESDNLNESVNSKYIRLKLNECVALLENGDRGMGESTQILCDLLDVVGCRGITKEDAQGYVLHHKDANHKNNRIFNLLLVPKLSNLHIKSHKVAYDKTNPNTVKHLTTPIAVPSYSKEVDKGLRGIGAIDVYASLYSGNIIFY